MSESTRSGAANEHYKCGCEVNYHGGDSAPMACPTHGKAKESSRLSRQGALPEGLHDCFRLAALHIQGYHASYRAFIREVTRLKEDSDALLTERQRADQIHKRAKALRIEHVIGHSTDSEVQTLLKNFELVAASQIALRETEAQLRSAHDQITALQEAFNKHTAARMELAKKHMFPGDYSRFVADVAALGIDPSEPKA